MADNLDPQQIDDLITALNNLSAGLGGEKVAVDKEMQKLNKQMQQASLEHQKFQKNLNKGSEVLSNFADQSKQGASAFNVGINAAGSKAGEFGFVIGTLIGGPLGTFAKVLGSSIEAGARYVQAVNKQSDALFKTYQDLSRIGGSDITSGIDGVFNNLQRFGYGVAQLKDFSALIEQNSETLALLGGTVVEGTASFAKMSEDIRNSNVGYQLQVMGKTVADLNKGEAQYLRLQTTLGQTQTQTQEQLTQGAKDYLFQQDRLAKLTGISADKQQQINEEAASEERFGAYIRGIKAKAAEAEARGDTEQAAVLRKKASDAFLVNQVLTTQGGKQLAQGYRDLSTGTIASSKAATQLYLGYPALAAAMRRGASATDVLSAAAGGARQNMKQFDKLREYGVADEIFGLGSEAAKLSNLTTEQAQRLYEANTQQGANNAQVNANTVDMAELNMKQQAFGKSLDRLVNMGIGPVTTAMNTLASGLETIAKLIDGIDDLIHGRFGSLMGNDTKVEAKGAGWFGKGMFQKPSESSVYQGAPVGEQGRQVVGSNDARAKAEAYLGKKISDGEYSALIKATHAEAGAGKNASQTEQAMIMASILNRARTDPKGILGALYAKNQFQSVTGTAADGHQPSKNFLQGPNADRLASIEGGTALLDQISRDQKNFTAASAAAYGPGTNIGYRNQMMAAGGQTIGGTVFQTAGPTGGYKSSVPGGPQVASGATAGAEAPARAEAASSMDQFHATMKQMASNMSDLLRVNTKQLGTQEKLLAKTN